MFNRIFSLFQSKGHRLYQAIKSGNEEEVRRLLAQLPIPTLEEIRGKWVHPSSLSLSTQYPNIFKLLLPIYGNEIDIYEKSRILLYAAKNGHIEALSIILADDSSIEPMLSELYYHYGNEVFCNILNKKNATTNEEEKLRYQVIIDRLLHIPEVAFLNAVARGDETEVNAMVQNPLVKIHDDAQDNAVKSAIQIGYAPMVKILLSQYKQRLNIVNISDDMIHLSCQKMNLEILNILLEEKHILKHVSYSLIQNIQHRMKENEFSNKNERSCYQVAIDRLLQIPKMAFWNAIEKNDEIELESCLNKYKINEAVKYHSFKKIVTRKDGNIKIIALLLKDHDVIDRVVNELCYSENDTVFSKIQEEKDKSSKEDKLHYQAVMDAFFQIPEVALLDAIEKNDDVKVNSLLMQYRINKYLKKKAFHLAAIHADAPIIRILLTQWKGALHWCRTNEAISLACENGNIETLNELLGNKLILKDFIQDSGGKFGINYIKSQRELNKEIMDEEEKLRYQSVIERLLQIPEVALFDAVERDDQIAVEYSLCNNRITDQVIFEAFQEAIKYRKDSVIKNISSHGSEFLNIHQRIDLIDLAIQYGNYVGLNSLLYNSDDVIFSLRRNGNKFFINAKNQKNKAVTEDEKLRYECIVNRLLQIPEIELLDANEREDETKVKDLLQTHDFTPDVILMNLTQAAKMNYCSVIEVFLNQCSDTISLFPRNEQMEIISSACLNGNVESLNLLLDQTGFLESLLDSYYNSNVLNLIIKIKEKKDIVVTQEEKLRYQCIIERLLQIPEIELLDAVEREDETKIKDLLQTHDFTPDVILMNLTQAAKMNYCSVIEVFLNQCSDTISFFHHNDEMKIISSACLNGNVESLNLLLDQTGFLESLLDSYYNSDVLNLISKIKKKKDIAVTEEEKLRYQSVIDTLLQNPMLALLYAIKENDVAIINIFFKQYHNVIIQLTQPKIKNLIYSACEKGNLDSLNLLLNEEVFLKGLYTDLKDNSNEITKKIIDLKNKAENEEKVLSYDAIINRLLEIPEVNLLDFIDNEKETEVETLLSQHSINSDVKGRALYEASKKGLCSIISILLNQSGDVISEHFKYQSLYAVCYSGYLNALNILLADISVAATVSLRHYQAAERQVNDPENDPELRERCQSILNRLFQIDLIRQLVQREDNLSYLANNSESSMTKVTKTERSLINHLKEHYKSVYESKSWKEIHTEILSYLEHEYHQSPAIDGYHWVWMLPDNSKLPVDFIPADTIGLRPQGEKTTLYWRDIKGDLQQKEVNTVDVLACYQGKENWLYQNTQDVTLLKTVLETLGVPIHPYQDIKCPLEYDKDYSHPSALVAYYRHLMHNAWRYFSKHNPWMDDKAPFTHTSENGNRCAIINDSAKELISYLWIALDGNVPLEPGFTKEGNLRLFAGVISENNRGHNGDEKPFYSEDLDAYNNIVNQHQGNDELIRQLLLELRITLTTADDLKADKPTCVWGIIKRLLQIFYGHPHINAPEAQSLDLRIILQRMEDHLIKPKEKTAEFDNFSDKVNALGNEEILTYIFQRISDICALEAFDEDDRIMLRENNFDKYQSIIDIPVKQLHAFLEQTKRWFGKERIEEKHDEGLKLDAGSENTFLNKPHDSYEEFIECCASNILEAFAKTIYDIVDKRLQVLEELSCKDEEMNENKQEEESDICDIKTQPLLYNSVGKKRNRDEALDLSDEPNANPSKRPRL